MWQQCEESTTISKVYPVTRRFTLDQLIVAHKEIEHCFHICGCSLHGDLTRVLFSANNAATKT
jgi:hypothetical protein